MRDERSWSEWSADLVADVLDHAITFVVLCLFVVTMAIWTAWKIDLVTFESVYPSAETEWREIAPLDPVPVHHRVSREKKASRQH